MWLLSNNLLVVGRNSNSNVPQDSRVLSDEPGEYRNEGPHDGDAYGIRVLSNR